MTTVLIAIQIADDEAVPPVGYPLDVVGQYPLNTDIHYGGKVMDNPADAWYTLYDYIEGCDDFSDEQCEAIDALGAFFLNIVKED